MLICSKSCTLPTFYNDIRIIFKNVLLLQKVLNLVPTVTLSFTSVPQAEKV